MKKIIYLGLMSISLCVLSSCSVVMAAKKEGTTVAKVQQCRTRSQFIAQGASIMSSERQANGDLIEIYRFKKERGSVARAFMHGVLDVSTCGLWEVVGTPIEGCDSDEYFCLKVTYDGEENIKNISLS